MTPESIVSLTEGQALVSLTSRAIPNPWDKPSEIRCGDRLKYSSFLWIDGEVQAVCIHPRIDPKLQNVFIMKASDIEVVQCRNQTTQTQDA